jgi:hypothetical protein
VSGKEGISPPMGCPYLFFGWLVTFPYVLICLWIYDAYTYIPYIHVYIFIYIFIYIIIYIIIYIRIHRYIHIHTYIYNIYTRICLHMYIYIFTYTYLHSYIDIYIYIYIHTAIHLQNPQMVSGKMMIFCTNEIYRVYVG